MKLKRYIGFFIPLLYFLLYCSEIKTAPLEGNFDISSSEGNDLDLIRLKIQEVIKDRLKSKWPKVLHYLSTLPPENATERTGRFVDPVLLALLIANDDEPGPPPPPYPSIGLDAYGGLSEKGVIDLATIGMMTILGLAIISKMPQQIAPVYIIADTGKSKEKPEVSVTKPPISGPQMSVIPPEKQNAMISYLYRNVSEAADPCTENDDNGCSSSNGGSGGTTEGELPQFIQVRVNYSGMEPVSMDIINEGNFRKGYQYREPRPIPNTAFDRRELLNRRQNSLDLND